jgi:hypothetical protein
MSTTSRRTPPLKRPAIGHTDDLAVLERERDSDEPSRIEQDRWRGEGVVGDNHTD